MEVWAEAPIGSCKVAPEESPRYIRRSGVESAAANGHRRRHGEDEEEEVEEVEDEEEKQAREVEGRGGGRSRDG